MNGGIGGRVVEGRVVRWAAGRGVGGALGQRGAGQRDGQQDGQQERRDKAGAIGNESR